MFKAKEKSVNSPSHSYKGFTLAETLITLVVIGVVAALTIPNLIVNHQKEETITRLKKVYSSLSQITNKAIADNGSIESWTVESGKTKEFVEKYMLPYLSVGKNCGYKSVDECRFQYARLDRPNNKNTFGDDEYKFILADGSSIAVYVSTWSQQVAQNVFVPCSHAILYVDINGQKGPDVLGKDIFCFRYFIQYDLTPGGGYNLSGKLLPYYATPITDSLTREDYIESCNKNSGGLGCASLIVADGWRIADDYPW